MLLSWHMQCCHCYTLCKHSCLFLFSNQCLLLQQESMTFQIQTEENDHFGDVLDSVAFKNILIKETYEKSVFYSCTLVTVYWMKPRHEIGCRPSVKAQGIMLITGFMSLLSEVLFLITPWTTRSEKVLSTVSRVTFH